jgi:hypothetical protein
VKFTLSTVLILIFISINSCSNPPSIPPKRDSLSSPISLAGKLYFFAPELDSTKLEATGACDCCSSNMLFLDDSSFLYISYCEGSTSYTRGKYTSDHQKLTVALDSITVDKYYPEENDSTGTLSINPVYHTSIQQPDNQTFKKQEYKGITLLINHVVGAPDKGTSIGEMMKIIHDEGVWDRLNTNPASIPRNSPNIEAFLQGTWTKPDDTTASLKIMEDTILYFDHSQKLPYRLNHDSLKITSNHNELVYPVKMRGNDTLIFDGPEKQTYYRYYNNK